MPQVPAAQGPRVALGVTPNARLDVPNAAVPDARLNAPLLNTTSLVTPQLRPALTNPDVRNPNAIRPVQLSTAQGDMAQQMGRDITQAGGALMQAAQQMQVKVNATVVDDALNDARETARKLTWGEADGNGGLKGGYRNAKGYDAIKRASGKPLDEEVSEGFDAQIRDIAAKKISNPAQRRAFESQVADMAAQLRQGAAVWQADQFDTYHAGVYTGMVSNLTAGFAAQDPGDMAGQRKAIGELEGAVSTLAANKGASAQELDVGLRAARSSAVAGLFDKVVADKKYSTAQALLNEWSDKIDPNTAAKMKLTLDGHVGTQLGEQIADDTWSSWGQPAFKATDTDRAFNVAVSMESRGRQVDDAGKIITSPKGARGVAQLMPDTAKEVAKGLGRPELADLAFKPTKEGEAANRLLGKVYFDKMVTRYKGDVSKAMAAYNAGPGRVDDAIKTAATTGQDWRTLVPRETQDYVSKGMKSFGSGEGAPAKPRKADMYARVDARTDDPDVRRAAYAKLDRQFAAAEFDEQNGHETAYAEGMRIVRETGGNISAIPPTLKAQIKPDQFTTLETYAKNTVEGGYRTTKPEAYYTLMNQTTLAKMTPAQLEAARPDLSEQDFNTVRSTWEALQKPQPGKGPNDLDVSTLDDIVDNRLQYMGINTKPDKKDVAGIARMGAIRQFAHQYVLDQQKQTGQKFTDYKQLNDVVNVLFTRNATFKTTFMGIPTGERTANVMTATAKDMPPTTRSKITTELERHLGRKASEAEVLQAYMRTQFYTGGASGR